VYCFFFKAYNRVERSWKPAVLKPTATLNADEEHLHTQQSAESVICVYCSLQVLPLFSPCFTCKVASFFSSSEVTHLSCSSQANGFPRVHVGARLIALRSGRPSGSPRAGIISRFGLQYLLLGVSSASISVKISQLLSSPTLVWERS
jgi:hypothetical protein